jgi:hypothetical protein
MRVEIDTKIAEMAATFRAALAADGSKIDRSIERLDRLLSQWEASGGGTDPRLTH